MRIVLIAALCAALAVPAHAQLTVNGVTLPAAMTIGESSSLTLNGGGIRQKLFFKLYVGGLYLVEKRSDPQAVIDSDEAMAELAARDEFSARVQRSMFGYMEKSSENLKFDELGYLNKRIGT